MQVKFNTEELENFILLKIVSKILLVSSLSSSVLSFTQNILKKEKNDKSY